MFSCCCFWVTIFFFVVDSWVEVWDLSGGWGNGKGESGVSGDVWWEWMLTRVAWTRTVVKTTWQTFQVRAENARVSASLPPLQLRRSIVAVLYCRPASLGNCDRHGSVYNYLLLILLKLHIYVCHSHLVNDSVISRMCQLSNQLGIVLITTACQAP